MEKALIIGARGLFASTLFSDTASGLRSFTEISLPFILIIFLMKGEDDTSVKKPNSPKVLPEQRINEVLKKLTLPFAQKPGKNAHANMHDAAI